jgi:hypothetical protein
MSVSPRPPLRATACSPRARRLPWLPPCTRRWRCYRGPAPWPTAAWRTATARVWRSRARTRAARPPTPRPAAAAARAATTTTTTRRWTRTTTGAAAAWRETSAAATIKAKKDLPAAAATATATRRRWGGGTGPGQGGAAPGGSRWRWPPGPAARRFLSHGRRRPRSPRTRSARRSGRRRTASSGRTASPPGTHEPTHPPPCHASHRAHRNPIRACSRTNHKLHTRRRRQRPESPCRHTRASSSSMFF